MDTMTLENCIRGGDRPGCLTLPLRREQCRCIPQSTMCRDTLLFLPYMPSSVIVTPVVSEALKGSPDCSLGLPDITFLLG